MLRILKYVIYDVLRTRMVIGYTILLLLFSTALFWFGSDDSKTIVSILQVVLLIVPLISIISATIHYYNSREFIELLLTQPIVRQKILFGEFLGVSISLSIAFLVGIGIPMLVRVADMSAIFLVLNGIFLTFIFCALAFLSSVKSNDKAKGIGFSLLLWFYFTILFDGIVLFILYYFNDYPLEKAVLFLTAINPIDLARVMILLKLDTAALMGYTGALYQKFFGSGFGIFFTFFSMLAWLIVPLTVTNFVFTKKDL